MFTKLDEFLASYRQLTEGTGKILAALDNACLSCPIAPGHRTLGQIAWHVTTSVSEMMAHTGLPMTPPASKLPPATARAIAEEYQRSTSELMKVISSQWTDASLRETDDMYGERWPRGLTLRILIDHEMHHRGQMTVLMRQAGIPVPGIFGPAKEDWAKMGMKPPAC